MWSFANGVLKSTRLYIGNTGCCFNVRTKTFTKPCVNTKQTSIIYDIFRIVVYALWYCYISLVVLTVFSTCLGAILVTLLVHTTTKTFQVPTKCCRWHSLSWLIILVMPYFFYIRFCCRRYTHFMFLSLLLRFVGRGFTLGQQLSTRNLWSSAAASTGPCSFFCTGEGVGQISSLSNRWSLQSGRMCCVVCSAFSQGHIRGWHEAESLIHVLVLSSYKRIKTHKRFKMNAI